MPSEQPTFAKLAPSIAHAPGLFTSSPKGSPDQLIKLDYPVGELHFRFVGPQLGPAELRVLLGLVGIAGPQNPRGTAPPPDGPVDRAQALLSRRATVRTTINHLAQAIGYSANSGSAHTTIRNALERLFSVSVFVGRANEPSWKDLAAGHLLAKLRSRESGVMLEVELCPVLAAAVMGGKGEYLRVDLAEVRQLKSDAALLLYRRLHWINPGASGDVKLDTMVSYVWQGQAVPASTMRTRRQVLRRALTELKELGWTFTSVGSTYSIRRPAGWQTRPLS